MFKKIILLCFCSIVLSCNNKDGININSQIDYAPIAVCKNGFAGEYPCNDYDLLSHFNLDELAGSGTEGNDSWGWTDLETNKEYALMAINKGIVFIDITDPANTLILGLLETATVNSSWRDVKVYDS